MDPHEKQAEEEGWHHICSCSEGRGNETMGSVNHTGVSEEIVRQHT